MRGRTGKWFECIVQYEKVTEDGREKKVRESYVVEAVCFGDAETTIGEILQGWGIGDFEVVNINPTQYKEVFISEDKTADLWYKAKLQFIIIDEKTEKEKRSNVYYLVQAESFDQAKKNIEEVMRNSITDYTILEVKETNIIELFEYEE